MEEYLQELGRKGCAPETLRSYRWNLQAFYKTLPEGRLQPGATQRWRDNLLQQGYQPNTVKHRLSSVNGMLSHLGLWQYQVENLPTVDPDLQPSLSRGEYLRLLRAARSMRKPKAYLLCKVIASTGLAVNCMDAVTVEAVKAREIPPVTGKGRPLPLPGTLAEELLQYAGDQGISSGPLFVTRTGRPLSRANITLAVQKLAEEAGLPPEKCNPRCLQRLYHTTLQGIEDNVARLARQAYESLLEQEQLAIGWEGGFLR